MHQIVWNWMQNGLSVHIQNCCSASGNAVMFVMTKDDGQTGRPDAKAIVRDAACRLATSITAHTVTGLLEMDRQRYRGPG